MQVEKRYMKINFGISGFLRILEKLFDWFVLLSDSEYKNQILHLLPDTNNNIQNELKFHLISHL